MTTPRWDPAQYLRHAGHRARPFADLLARIPALPGDRPRIADLGCGPGNVTALLAGRWPTARITGYDNSPEMLDKAHVDHEGPTAGGRLDFAHADLRTWTPTEPYDLIVSNATLQWVPGHTDRFPDWIAALTPGGTLAFQVPDNIDAPLHALMRDLAATPAGATASPACCAAPTPSPPPAPTWTCSPASAARPTCGRRPTSTSWAARTRSSTGSRAPACAPP